MNEREQLLCFVLPGLTHGLGNALFAIQGHAQVLGTNGGDVGRERSAILKATDKARWALAVLTHVQEDGGSVPPVQAGIAVHRLCELLRLPMRERGLRVAYRHSSNETPLQVDGKTLCCAIVAAARRIVDVMPAGCEGTVEIDVAGQRGSVVLVALRVVHDRAQLPFPLDLAAVRADLLGCVGAWGVQVEPVAARGELRLLVPVSTTAGLLNA